MDGGGFFFTTHKDAADSHAKNIQVSAVPMNATIASISPEGDADRGGYL